MYMKLPIIGPLLKMAALLLLLGSFIASVRSTQAAGFLTRSVDGYLLVYSATDEVSDGDIAFNPHSSYVIYNTDGKFLRNVENHISRSDELPELVKLAPGSYALEARSANDGYVRVPVAIKPGRRTILDLDSRS
jgi:hypothetical protein